MGRGRGGSDPRSILLGGATRIRSGDDNFLNLISNGDPKDANVFWEKLKSADEGIKSALLKLNNLEIYDTEGFQSLLDLEIKRSFSKEYVASLGKKDKKLCARWVLSDLRKLLKEDKTPALNNILFYKGASLGDTDSRAEEIIAFRFGSSGDVWRAYQELNIARIKGTDDLEPLGEPGDTLEYDERMVYSIVPVTTKRFMAGNQPGITGYKTFLSGLNERFKFEDNELQKLESDFERKDTRIADSVADAFRQGAEINEIIFRNYYSSEIYQNMNSAIYRAVIKNYDLGINQAIEDEIKEHGGETVLKRFLPIFENYPEAESDRKEFLELFEDPIFEDFDKEHIKDLVQTFSKTYVSSNLYGKDTCDLAEANKVFLEKFTNIAFDEGMRQL